MNIIYLLVPLALSISAGAVVAFAWAVRRGQLDDLETPALRILGEDGGQHPSARANDKRYS
jgi:cbb3-type cytochrome oxidase maturation protein